MEKNRKYSRPAVEVIKPVPTRMAASSNMNVSNSAVETKLNNPVEQFWNITLLYGKHWKFTKNTYAVMFKSKLGDHDSECFLFVDLLEHQDKCLMELNAIGSMDQGEFHSAIDYVKQLKMNDTFHRVPNLQLVMDGTASADESREVYQLVLDVVQNDPGAFPTINSGEYDSKVSLGVILDTQQYMKKYGAKTVGVTTKTLLDILDMENGEQRTKRYKDIMHGLLDKGYMLQTSLDKKRFQDPVKPTSKAKQAKRFCIFKLDGVAKDE